MTDLKQGFANVGRWLRAHLFRWLALLVHSLFLFYLTAYFQSVNFHLGNEDVVLTGMELIKSALPNIEDHENPEDYLFINTTYSKQLIPKFDADGMPVGEEPITSRQQLLDLSRLLSNSDYKYLIIDIFFQDKLPEDSAFEAELFTLQNKIIPYHIDDQGQMQLPVIESTRGLADIKSINGFVNKYKLHDQGKKLIPLLMYEKLYNTEYSHYGPFGTMNGGVLMNAFPLSFRIRNFNIMGESERDENVETGERGVWNYYELKTLLDIPSDFFHQVVKDKIIVVGDYNNDQFDSYVGKISGPLILLNAFLSLKYEDPFLTWPYVLFILIFYMFLSHLIFKPLDFLDKLYRNKAGQEVIKVNSLLKPLKLGLLIACCTLISYIVFGKYISLFFLTVYVLLLDYLVKAGYYLIPRLKAWQKGKSSETADSI